MFAEYMKLRNKHPELPADRVLRQLRYQASVADLCLERSCYHYNTPTEIYYPDMPSNSSITLTVKYEDYPETPWEFCEGYGTIKPMQRYAEYAGNGNIQVRSYGRENYYYNFAEALSKAIKDFYNPKTGRAETYRKALKAVQGEMKFFEGYLCDDWSYVAIHVQAHREGEEVFDDWVGMYQSDDWHEGAFDLIHEARRAIFATKYAGATVGAL
jgi:hypothetical protein